MVAVFLVSTTLVFTSRARLVVAEPIAVRLLHVFPQLGVRRCLYPHVPWSYGEFGDDVLAVVPGLRYAISAYSGGVTVLIGYMFRPLARDDASSPLTDGGVHTILSPYSSCVTSFTRFVHNAVSCPRVRAAFGAPCWGWFFATAWPWKVGGVDILWHNKGVGSTFPYCQA